MRYATLLLSLIIAGGLHAQSKSFVKDAQQVELKSLAAIPKSYFGKTVKFTIYNRGKEGYLDSDVKKALPESSFYHFDTSISWSQRRAFTVVAPFKDKDLINKITGSQIGSYVELVGKVGYHKSRKIWFVAVLDVSTSAGGGIAQAERADAKKLHTYKHMTAEKMVINKEAHRGKVIAVNFRYVDSGLLDYYGKNLGVTDKDFMVVRIADYSNSYTNIIPILRRTTENEKFIKNHRSGKPIVLVGQLFSRSISPNSSTVYWGLRADLAYTNQSYQQKVEEAKSATPDTPVADAPDANGKGDDASAKGSKGNTANAGASLNDVISEAISNYYDTAIMGNTLSHAIHPSRLDKIKRTYANKNPYRIWALSAQGKQVKQYKVFKIVAISDETQMIVGRLYFKDHTSRLVTNMMKQDSHGAWKIWE